MQAVGLATMAFLLVWGSLATPRYLTIATEAGIAQRPTHEHHPLARLLVAPLLVTLDRAYSNEGFAVSPSCRQFQFLLHMAYMEFYHTS